MDKIERSLKETFRRDVDTFGGKDTFVRFGALLQLDMFVIQLRRHIGTFG